MSSLGEGPRNLWLSSRRLSEIRDPKPDHEPDALAKTNGRWLRVEVRDSGPGLAREAVGKIFNAFFTTKSHGLGMGLAICRSIIQAHGGTTVGRERCSLRRDIPIYPPGRGWSVTGGPRRSRRRRNRRFFGARELPPKRNVAARLVAGSGESEHHPRSESLGSARNR